MKRAAWGLAAATWLSVLAGLALEALGFEFPMRRGMIAASTGFVLVRLLSGGLNVAPGRLLLGGLIGCWAGDYLGPINFPASIIAFGLAHALFIAAFVALGIDRRRIAAATAVTVAVGAAIGWWLLPEVPAGQRAMIGGYILVISAMVVCAWSLRDSGARGTLIAAATLFYVSDIFVARWRFISSGPENAWLCYPLYYGACLLFALAPAKRESAGSEPRSKTPAHGGPASTGEFRGSDTNRS